MRIGMIRKVDNFGRVTIPKEYREFYHMNEQEQICLIDTADGILLVNPKYKVVEVNSEKN